MPTICLTADCCNGPFPEHANRPRWQAIFDMARVLRSVVARATDGAGVITWFVRADNQIGSTLGHPLSCFTYFMPILADFVRQGDAIGFHPHCYKLGPNQSWLPETNDLANASMILNVAKGLAELPFPVTVARIGEAHMTPLLMEVLRDCGFVADCTGLPGRLRETPPTHDWSHTPTAPYRPSPEDYQSARTDGADGMWEIPFSMMPIQGPRSAPYKRYLNLGFKPEYLAPALATWVPEQTHITAIMHPVECLPVGPDVAGEFPLLAFEAEAVASNVESIHASGVEWKTIPGMVS
ncbi:MAG: hypothetical protein ABI743_05090 [bacterium]